jgi:16S rRNA (adenine1518-N6/adenine1519-N6)-dimethyltransferase
MKLSEIRQLVSEKGLRLTKSLGQNFLHDGNQLNRILELAELTKSDKVLEIGPGLGPLTELLMQKAGELLAIEKDERLVQVLNERLHGGPSQNRPQTLASLQVLHDDALEYLRREPRDWTGWKVVSNLPYSVASPILVELAQSPRGPERMVATLQIEVARRLMAKAGAEDYGVLTLLAQADYEPRGWFKIPATCFFPEPDVDSACVSLVRRKEPKVTSESRPIFEKLVKRAFSQRRKMMMKLLREDWPAQQLERAFAALELPVQTRAEAVTLEQFAALTGWLSASSGSSCDAAGKDPH